MRFIITTHRWLEGVALSLAGQWGGQRYPNDRAAVTAAHEYAGDRPHTIERQKA